MFNKYKYYYIQMTNSISSQLKQRCLKRIRVPGDGNCQFRALAYMIKHNNIPHKGQNIDHKNLRNLAIRLIKKQKSHYKNFVWDQCFSDYIDDMRNGAYGDNLTLQALADYFNMCIIVLRHKRQHNIVNNGKHQITLVYSGDDGDDAHYDATTSIKNCITHVPSTVTTRKSHKSHKSHKSRERASKTHRKARARKTHCKTHRKTRAVKSHARKTHRKTHARKTHRKTRARKTHRKTHRKTRAVKSRTRKTRARKTHHK